MTVYIDTEEHYPVYTLEDRAPGVMCDVPDDIVARWKRVQAEYDTMQDEMKTFFRSSPL